jgi:hypothetical protein
MNIYDFQHAGRITKAVVFGDQLKGLCMIVDLLDLMGSQQYSIVVKTLTIMNCYK